MHPFDAKLLIENQKGKFFKVAFLRKNPKFETINGVRTMVEPAGALRVMLCRRGVKKYVKGVIDPAIRRMEDTVHDVLTVFDVEKFLELRRSVKNCPTCTGTGCGFCKGGIRPLSLKEAGFGSYRRINLKEIVSFSFLEKIKVTKAHGVKVTNA